MGKGLLFLTAAFILSGSALLYSGVNEGSQQNDIKIRY